MAGSSGLPPWCRTQAWPPPCSRWSRASNRTRRLDSVLQRLRVGLFARPRFVRTRRPRLDAEQQGNPKTTQFFIPCFLSVTFSILSRSLPQAFFFFFFFSHLVLGMSHLTELLGHLGLNGFYSFTGNHPIPPTHLQLQYHSFQCR